jgi:putative ABC transport system permease protein
MYGLLKDVRFSLRLMRKHPGMSLLVLAALILGIGINSAVFSVVYSVLLRPAPLTEAERIAFVFAKSQQSAFVTISYPEFQDMRAQSRAFQSMAAYKYFIFNLTGNGTPEEMKTAAGTAGIFEAIGIRPIIGRGIQDADEKPGAPRVAVISHALWQRKFNGDSAVVGKTMVLDRQLYTIIGVLPPNDFPLVQQDVWVGIGPFLDQHMMNRETRHFAVLGRLSRSATIETAQKEMEGIAGRLALQYPYSNKDLSANVSRLIDAFTAGDRQPLWLIMVASGVVLLLACLNVMTVFIATAIERGKELSLRLALGAPRSALLRQLFIQSLMFATAGAFLGLELAKLGLAYLIQKYPFAVFRFKETTMDHTVVCFTILLAFGCTLAASILPALYTSKLNIYRELKGDWNWTSLFRLRAFGQNALIVFEVALAAGLSLVSGLLIKSFSELKKADMGFNPRYVAFFQMALPKTQYKDDAAQTAFYRQAIENLKNVPGVESASAAVTLPLVNGTYFINLQVDAQSPHAEERPFVDSNAVLPGFLAIMKIPILQGRDFTTSDGADSPPVAIIDEVLAASMWPGQNPLGKRLRLADITDNSAPWREVVGVVRQIKYTGPAGKILRMQVYEPAYQHPSPIFSFVLRSATPLAVLRLPVEKAIHDVASDLPLNKFQTLEGSLAQMESGRKICMILLSSFAFVGISLGMIGIYAVVSNSVIRRRREIAIRMALGAGMRNSILQVTKMGFMATAGGIILGSALVICFTKVLAAFLYGVKTLDPEIYLLNALVIAGLALVAGLVPASSLLQLTPREILKE